jgi:hypothetical protein
LEITLKKKTSYKIKKKKKSFLKAQMKEAGKEGRMIGNGIREPEH